MRILFVENHAAFASTVMKAFLAAHEVTLVPTVSDALARLHDGGPFDAVLVDYDLDDGKGDEVVAAAVALSPRPRIIAVSAHERGNNALVAAGADAVCGKLEFQRISEVL